MKTSAKFLICSAVACLAMAIVPEAAHASGPIAVYARIDKVTVTPSADTPQYIRIDGVFSVATSDSTAIYSAPMPGYIYFSLPEANADLARNEWNDLKALQPGAVIGLGSQWMSSARIRVRNAREPEANPDPYPLGNGLIHMNASNAHAKALFDYK
jgi:hypothetical protein